MKNKLLFLLFTFFALHMYGQQDIDIELFAEGFSSPVDIRNNGDDRLYVVERRGYIKIVDADGSVLSTPFLDIDSKVFNASNQDERGLLGLAFHPQYSDNGYIFVNYINNASNTVIARYSRSESDPEVINPDSEVILLTIVQPVWNHNGGCLSFGPDGYLYIGMGDGGSGDDPFNNGQNTQTLLGKMLRIDVNQGDNYAIPSDNPFVNNPDVLDEVWAIGLRNPWRFSFDTETGDLWIGDVGQGQREEIDFQAFDSPGGENYGWRCYEGTRFTGNSSANDCQENYTDPIYEVLHNGFSGPCSITGGYVYRGSKYADLKGKYICGDYCTGEFFAVTQLEDGTFEGSKIAQYNHDISTFGIDASGEMYFASFSSGKIYRIKGKVTTALTHEILVKNFEIKPNPFQHDIRIEATLIKALDISIHIVDGIGNTVLEKHLGIDDQVSISFDLSSIPKGSYIVNLMSGDRLLSKKVIKQ